MPQPVRVVRAREPRASTDRRDRLLTPQLGQRSLLSAGHLANAREQRVRYNLCGAESRRRTDGGRRTAGGGGGGGGGPVTDA